METEKRACSSCKYFIQHYAKIGLKIRAVNCGFCNTHSNKKKQKFDVCSYWEDAAVQKEERKKSVKETLELISERLNDIAMILNDDKEG